MALAAAEEGDVREAETLMNRQFLAMCDRIIAEHAYADMFRHKKRTGKRAGYSLSPNTEFLLDVKKAYLAGEISEEEAKAVFLKQRLFGNLV